MTVTHSPASTLSTTAPERRPSRPSYVTMRVLMLVIGYVAPLPAKEARHAAT